MFQIGDYVYADDWAYGMIIDIDYVMQEAFVEFETVSGGGSLWFSFDELKLDEQ